MAPHGRLGQPAHVPLFEPIFESSRTGTACTSSYHTAIVIAAPANLTALDTIS